MLTPTLDVFVYRSRHFARRQNIKKFLTQFLQKSVAKSQDQFPMTLFLGNMILDSAIERTQGRVFGLHTVRRRGLAIPCKEEQRS